MVWVIMIFFSSDHHFGHNNIIQYCNRQFRSVEEMNDAMVEYWNETVTPNDEVYYLGDFSLRYEYFKMFCPRLKGKIFFVPGNHDQCWGKSSWTEEKRATRIKMYEDCGVAVLPKILTKNFEGTHFVLSHLPYGGARETDERDFGKHHPKDEGSYLLHGHVHNAWKKNGRQINVGADVWNFRPVSLKQIHELIDKEKG